MVSASKDLNSKWREWSIRQRFWPASASWAVLYRRLSPPVFSGIPKLHQSLWLTFLQLFKSPVVVSRSHNASLKSCIRQVTDVKVSRGKTLHVNISFRATSWQINGFDGLQTPSLASYLICCLWIPDRSPDCPCVYQTQTQPWEDLDCPSNIVSWESEWCLGVRDLGWDCVWDLLPMRI